MAKLQLKPVKDAHRRNAIINAISNFEVSESAAWNSLDVLSSRTRVDAIEANTESIFDAGNDKFEALATVYVVLNYGGGKDNLSTTDAFPVHVSGKADKAGQVEIEDFSIDTSSFYGEAEA